MSNEDHKKALTAIGELNEALSAIDKALLTIIQILKKDLKEQPIICHCKTCSSHSSNG